MSKSTLEMPSVSWLAPCLLLLLQKQDSYGSDLELGVADLGLGATRPGEMYRTLRQMEQEGMVLCERDGFDCRLSRRRYAITQSGKAYLEFWADSLAEYRKPVEVFLHVYAGEAGREVYG